MAEYTVMLKTLLEAGFDLGLDKYPIFDENYRRELNNKILRHYFFREIGQETAELFKFYLNQTMAENMVYFNQLYKTALIEFNPLENYRVTESVSKSGEQNDDFSGNDTTTKSESGASTKTDTSSATESAENLSVFSDTPQGLLSIGDIKNQTYASTANAAEGTTTGSDEAESIAEYSSSGETGTVSESLNKRDYFENVIKTVSGTMKENPSEMLKKFRETFLNIDKMVIESLSGLFMKLW